MKNLLEGKKKVVAIVGAGIIGMSALGGSVFAYQDAWTAKIQQGVQYLADNIIFKGDIENAVKAEGDKTSQQLNTDGKGLISQIYNDFLKFKQDEINRGVKAVDDEYNTDKTNITSVAINAEQTQKDAQTAKTNTDIQNAKAQLDAVVESYLKQIPNSK